MLTDPISNYLTQIKNGYLAHKDSIKTPYSVHKYALAEILSKEGFIGKVSLDKKDKLKLMIISELIYEGKRPKLNDVVRISKPGKRVYAGSKEIPVVLGGLGISIVSTPKGLMNNKDARKKKLGGELICKIW